ncbi:MAG: Na+/H+ antiporter subunit E [Desulfurococcaceae archaeon]
MKRLKSAIPLTILLFIIYIVFSGSLSTYDIVTGIVVSITVSIIFSTFVISNPSKILNFKRWLYLLEYALYYFFVAEVKCHLDVMYRILHPKLPVKPGIVAVPYNVSTDYAITAVANSITNTPGTVVVDIDTSKKTYYVHWIYVKTTKPDKAREEISSIFEKYAMKIFD